MLVLNALQATRRDTTGSHSVEALGDILDRTQGCRQPGSSRSDISKPREACGVTLVSIIPGNGIYEADERNYLSSRLWGLLTSRCRVLGGPRPSAMLGTCVGRETDSALREIADEDLAQPSYPAGKAHFRLSDTAYTAVSSRPERLLAALLSLLLFLVGVVRGSMSD
jgi:hypothetical protein